MSKELLTQELATLLSTINQVTEFSKEQLPLIAQEILTYGTVTGVILITVGLISSILFGLLSALIADDVGQLLGGMCAIVSLFALIAGVSKIIKIYVAPKLYLVEYVKGLA